MATNKLASKAAKLDFSKLPGMTAPPAAAPATPAAQAATTALPLPKTAPGALMAFANDARSSLLRENEQLRERAAQADALRSELEGARSHLAQWEGAKPARWLDPAQISRSRYANRHEINFNGAEYEQLKAEIGSAGGNVQPIKVRPLSASALAGTPGAPADGEAPRYEVVFGHRRLQACRELGLKVLAVVDELDDRDLFIEMDRENRARKDLSAWEQGMMYQRALDDGLFASNRKLAEAVGVDLGNLGRALALARLPLEVVQAFASPLDLQFRWAKPLADAAGADRAGLIRRARELAARKGTLNARAVFEQLVAPGAPAASAPPVQGGLYGTTPWPEAPIGIRSRGREVAQLHVGEGGAVSVTFEAGALEAGRLEALARHLEAFLGEPAAR